jgi:ribosomal-protein-alanine N-acetyltransferase
MATRKSMPVNLQRSIIRPYKDSDAESLATCANNPKIVRFMRNAFPHPYTLHHAKEWISMQSKSNPMYNFVIVHPVTGAVMGGIGLKPGEDVECRSAELGYYLGEEYWGQGVMPEAVLGFVDWAFSHFDGLDGLERIFVRIFHSNIASERVVLKAGFQFEGRMKKSVYKDGVMLDQLLYSVIREDWDKRRETV